MTDELERRLRDSLRAYADLVEPAPDAELSTRAPAPVRRPHRWPAAVLAAAAAAAVGGGSVWLVSDHDAVTAAGSAASEASAVSGTAEDDDAAAAGSAPDSAEALGAPAFAVGVAYPIDLPTHCGVLGADVGGVWFAAQPPLVGGAGDAPPGWDDPVQHGTVTLLSADEAVFGDAAGHSVRLRADEAARPPRCE